MQKICDVTCWVAIFFQVFAMIQLVKDNSEQDESEFSRLDITSDLTP